MKFQQKSTVNVCNNTDDDEGSDNSVSNSSSGIERGDCTKAAVSLYTSPSATVPMYAMAQWRHPRTRDGRSVVLVLLPTRTIYVEDGIKAQLITSDQQQLSVSWPRALLNAD